MPTNLSPRRTLSMHASLHAAGRGKTGDTIPAGDSRPTNRVLAIRDCGFMDVQQVDDWTLDANALC